MTDRFATEDGRAKAWRAREEAADGAFYVAVRTTRVFCKPSCAARPKRENIRFYSRREECLAGGFRPCLRCRP